MKYIMINGIQPIIFDDSISHAFLADKLADIGSVESAGFIIAKGGIIETFGHSESLNLPSSKADADIIQHAIHHKPHGGI